MNACTMGTDNRRTALADLANNRRGEFQSYALLPQVRILARTPTESRPIFGKAFLHTPAGRERGGSGETVSARVPR